MRARIYKPAKNAMQSGKARTKQWVLEYEPESPRTIDPLMGWTSSSDTQSQVRLRFESREALYDWYNSPAYRDARAIRHQSADTRFLVIVDEIDLDKISTADLIARPLAKD